MLQQDIFGQKFYNSDAVLSTDRVYRYLLERQWGDGGKTIGFICLNPSTADEAIDDPTVRRCIGFAKKWGGSRLLMGNLFAYRATNPKALLGCLDPVGPDNETWLSHIAEQADILIAAWGSHGKLSNRSEFVLKRFAGQFSALRLTSKGDPGHPLYLPGHLDPFPL